LVERKVKAEKDLLRHVLDILRPVDKAGDGTENPAPVGSDNCIERGIIAVLGFLDKVEVDQHAAPVQAAG
jgi:hypothetical protein